MTETIDTHAIAVEAASQRAAIQHPDELAPLLDLALSIKPKTIVEIGSMQGGAFWAFSKIATPDALLISIDYELYSTEAQLQSMVGPLQEAVKIYANSQDPATLDQLLEQLDGEPIDVLFIDADHALNTVTHDHTTYSALVRDGGIVALHDIIRDERYEPGCGVYILWPELAARATDAHEYIATGSGYGIGAYVAPLNPAPRVP